MGRRCDEICSFVGIVAFCSPSAVGELFIHGLVVLFPRSMNGFGTGLGRLGLFLLCMSRVIREGSNCATFLSAYAGSQGSYIILGVHSADL